MMTKKENVNQRKNLGTMNINLLTKIYTTMNELEKKVAELAANDEERIKVEIIMMLLSNATVEQLKKIKLYDVFKRLAISLINNSTEDDLEVFVKHNTILRLLKTLK